MLDKETIKNISTFVEITMQVEERLRSKYEQEAEPLTDELEAARTRACQQDEAICVLNEQVKDLTDQKDRQAATIKELLEVRARQAKELEEWRVGMPPHTDEELQKKLDKAMDHIRRQGEEIDKLRAGAADPRWIPMSEKRPRGGATVIVCTKRGVVDVATETVDGWKRSTGKMAEPVAWMPLPVKFTGGEE